MEEKLDKLVDFYDVIIEDSLKFFMKKKKLRKEYIQTDEITFKDKIQDLDELLEYSELREMYEECSVLLDMKKQIIKNNDIISLK
jgi:hypothetical protein